MCGENSTAGPGTAIGDSCPPFRCSLSDLVFHYSQSCFWQQDRAVKQARPGNNTLPQEPPCSPLKVSIQQGRDITLIKKKANNFPELHCSAVLFLHATKYCLIFPREKRGAIDSATNVYCISLFLIFK